MKISKVYIYANGNIMVFDDHGKQIADIQGKGLSGLHEVEKFRDVETVIGFSDFRSGDFIPISAEVFPYFLTYIKVKKG